jgi:hypothetical protein
VQCSPMQGFQLSASSRYFRWTHAPTPHQFFNLINDLEERRRIHIAALRLFSAFPRMYR